MATQTPQFWADQAAAVALRHGIPPRLFVEQMRHESLNFDPRVISGAHRGPSGELGIAQILPRFHPKAQPLNPQAALNYAAGFMADLHGRFGDWGKALAAYNAGGDAVAKGNIPRSTYAYVNKIMTAAGMPPQPPSPIKGQYASMAIQPPQIPNDQQRLAQFQQVLGNPQLPVSDRKIIVVRHGTTSGNLGGVGKDIIRGWADLPTTKDGHRDNQMTSQALKNYPLDRIIYSDMARTRDSADAIARFHPEAERIELPHLRPWNLGELQGKQTTPDVINYVKELVRNPHASVQGGEPFNVFASRFTDFMKEIMGHPGNTALITHARNLQILEHWLKAGQDNGRMQKEFVEDLAGEPDSVVPGGFAVVQENPRGWEIVSKWPKTEEKQLLS